MSTTTSAFSKWFAPSTAFPSHRHNLLLDGAAQWALKYILFTVPLLHTKPRDGAAARRGTPSDELNVNHVLAERRRREKLNERFIILRSMVPFVTKMDKASILADTIEYLNQLKERIQELESTVQQMEAEKERRGGPTTAREKRKIRVVEAEVGESPPQVEVSIIESDALVEIQCLHKGGLLLDVMQILLGLGIQVTTVQSSINSATFTAELRAKVQFHFFR